ncbi:hypothetical protein FE697_015115 [Mumia zhuanghuii]|uniref:Uncharacterized protein n=2 Tax=Mumia TaxID=1546255 RepID=A0ABW1QR33_9ACTN|nr:MULTISPECIES: hypothetical protein [Mumia]KAA1422470.1 hypothetical protein FE697_015115 [Mumia zhuanghuii]
MSRAYLATHGDGLRALGRDGVLPADAYACVVAESDDEQDEYDAMAVAGEIAEERWGAVLVLATETDADEVTGTVALRDVEAIHVGDELAWYATQELETVIAGLGPSS